MERHLIKSCVAAGMLLCMTAAITAAASLESEGQAVADKFFAGKIKTCGDSQYVKWFWGPQRDTYWMEWKNFRLEVSKSDPITPADKLNGLEWSGSFKFTADTARLRDDRDRQWGQWVNGSGCQCSGTLKKLKGQWQFQPSPGSYPWLRDSSLFAFYDQSKPQVIYNLFWKDLAPFECSQVPK
jgi:hypothetical protein